jgi:hypothetical protein
LRRRDRREVRAAPQGFSGPCLANSIFDRHGPAEPGLKAAKDREQAAFLIEALPQDRPDDLRQANAAAMDVGPRWREHMANSLKRMEATGIILNGL